MKRLFAHLALFLTLFATLLQGAEGSFSTNEREKLLEELNSSSISLHKTKTYILKKGWNLLTTPSTGVAVPSTFDNSKIKFVTVYDYESKSWALFSPSESLKDKKILFLKYLEPNVAFFVYANDSVKLEIKSKSVDDTCQKIIDRNDYEFMIHSKLDKSENVNEKDRLVLQTRYFSHHERGKYDDTRVVFIYPKVKVKGEATYRYGPAQPKIALKYAKEYEEKEFFVYDYKFEKCYKGYFPSMRIPPYPILEVQD